MKFLNRIEDLYLASLRIVVLTGATVALVIAAVALIRAAPLLFGPPHATAQPGDQASLSLSQFISEQKAKGVDVTDALADATAGASPPAVSEDIKAAAQSLAHYINHRVGGGSDPEQIEQAFQTKSADVDEKYRPEYETRLRQLMVDLDKSAGKPLSVERINALIDWHQSSFKDMVTAREAKAVADAASEKASFLFGAGALLVFILTIFCFLFVKIERNLRLVHAVAKLDGETITQKAA